MKYTPHSARSQQNSRAVFHIDRLKDWTVALFLSALDAVVVSKDLPNTGIGKLGTRAKPRSWQREEAKGKGALARGHRISCPAVGIPKTQPSPERPS